MDVRSAQGPESSRRQRGRELNESGGDSLLIGMKIPSQMSCGPSEPAITWVGEFSLLLFTATVVSWSGL